MLQSMYAAEFLLETHRLLINYDRLTILYSVMADQPFISLRNMIQDTKQAKPIYD